MGLAPNPSGGTFIPSTFQCYPAVEGRKEPAFIPAKFKINY